MKRSTYVVPGLAAVVAVAILALAGPLNTPTTKAAASLEFEATFNTAGDFYDRFDRGYSGVSPWEWNNGGGAGATTSFHGDHNEACEGPTTQRTVSFGTAQNPDFDQLFWYCAPGNDPAKGHLMTGLDTLGYNIAWFAPKPTFSKVSEVCWDINETGMSHRKWTQLLFVDARPGADATRYPTGTVLTR